MIIFQNTLKVNRPATASSHGGDMTLHGNAGDILEVGFHFTGLTGSPSAVAVTGAKWQFAPKIMPALDEDTVSQSVGRVWFDVLKTNPTWAPYFVDEEGNSVDDWPSDLIPAGATFTGSYNVHMCVRKIKIPAGMLVRAAHNKPSFTGGTSPTLVMSQHVTQYSKLS